MEYSELIRSRYSCRSFQSKPVEDWKVEKIIEAAIVAPTAVNKQPFRIFRMESPEAREAIRSVTRFHFDADCFLVVGATQEDCFLRKFDQRPFADVDASIVATHMMLQIHDLGLGSTWVGYFDAPRLKALCPAMENFDLVAIFPIGYPAEDGGPSPRHLERKTAEELVITL